MGGSARGSEGGTLVAHTRARQLLEWLVPQLARFPREHRHSVTAHIARLAMRVQDQLIAARHLDAAGRAEALQQADIALDQLRQLLLLACTWHWLSEAQFRHVSGLTEELGRLIGGWRQRVARGRSAPRAPTLFDDEPGGPAPKPR
jgi:hypothetical protein